MIQKSQFECNLLRVNFKSQGNNGLKFNYLKFQQKFSLVRSNLDESRFSLLSIFEK